MFRFMIRDVLWLMVVCAVLILAYSDRLKTQRRIGDAEAGLEKSRAELDKREALVRKRESGAEALYEDIKKEYEVLKKQQDVMRDLQAQDAELRQRFPQVFPARPSVPKRIE